MLLVVGTIRLPADRVAEAKHAMRRMIEASRAEAACLEYCYSEDVVEVGLIRVIEMWRSLAGLEQHFASAHLAEWRAAGPTLGITDRNLVRYELNESIAT